MEPERWAQVRAVFEAVLALEPGEREAYLERQCSGDRALIEAVRTLLRAYREADTFLSTDSSPDSASPETASIELAAPAATVGRKIGPYVVRERVGEGAFGVVYRAERLEPVRHVVALKLLKPGMDTARVLARFQAERQALALMNHPNVARIHDAGATPEGRPYFAMEYVPGVQLTRHCDDQRLGIEERLVLFRQICAGVQHAHQKGIIHRDLKPSNILVSYVDGKAVPKIIDFGISKALNQPLSETVHTERGVFMGTFPYVSPEQAEATAQDVDTRADIYSLGVLLYELLTGALPFDREQFRAVEFEAVLKVIREDDPPRPSTKFSTLETRDPSTTSEAAQKRGVDPRTLTRSLRGDLDWITMKCLEKDRARRYESAAALAADVGRHLNDEPVEAGPPSLLYRARKFARRRRGPLAATAAIAVALLIGVVTTTAMAVNQARLQEQVNRKQAEDLVEEAKLLAYGERDLAWERVVQALELDANNVEALLEKARLLRRKGETDEAVNVAQGVLDLHPASGGAAAVLAGLLGEKDPQQSERYESLARSRLQEHELLHERALVESDPRKAVELFTRSLELQPWNFEAVWQRGVRRFALDDVEGAREDLDLAVKVRPDLALAWVNKGAVLLKAALETPLEIDVSQLVGQAILCLDRGIELDPRQPAAYFNRALARNELRRYEGALEDLNRVLELTPDGAWEAHMWRGDLRVALGDHAGALDDYDAAMRKIPATALPEDRIRILVSRGQVHRILEQPEKAGADLDSALALAPDDAWVQQSAGELALFRREYEKAYTHFSRAVELDPQFTIAILYRGVTGWLTGHDDRAIEDYAKFAESNDPDSPWIRLWIWEIETLRGNTRSAASQIGEVTQEPTLLNAVRRVFLGQAAPQDVLARAESVHDRLYAYYYLGIHAHGSGRREEARERFTQCIDLGLADTLEHQLARERLRRIDG